MKESAIKMRISRLITVIDKHNRQGNYEKVELYTEKLLKFVKQLNQYEIE